ncbi:MAG: excinuclease ABC subunit UvrA [Bacteroidales bacterium]|jgi:excinuclease ABC subunit A|nr:excinuclease ABC subunit UvrA [Bacteroidales bacterium]
MKEEKLEIFGAKENNLQNISLSIPRNALVTVTGLSGSGKSSLVFNTIYAEGQRRYLETFSAYIRYFIGNIQRPNVEKITGLSPVIAIEQKTTNKNPRSTVGTTTEIYDLLRLLYSKIADAYSINTGERMIQYSQEQIIEIIKNTYSNRMIIVLSPIIKGRKGHYRELFQDAQKKGFLKVRVDGKIENIIPQMQLDRYKIHDIELVIDKLKITSDIDNRLKKTIELAFKKGNGTLMILEEETNNVKYFSKDLMCPTTGISYPEAQPNTFSFNSPYGACPNCNGLGEVTQIDIEKIIPDNTKSLNQGGLIPLGKPNKNSWFVKQVEALGKKEGFTLDTPLKDFSQNAMKILLYGSDMDIETFDESFGIRTSSNSFQGVINFITSQMGENMPASILKWANSFTNKVVCPLCNGTKLKKESLCFRIEDKNIYQLSTMDIIALSSWINNLLNLLDERKKEIAKEIIREISTRINFLLDVGLGYLSLDRQMRSLSGGESQRIRLATQIGSKLVNVLYLLDEPSIGLHQRDNERLIESLKKLRDSGNSVIVVEHDKEMMLESDWIVDIGKGAGVNGGRVIFNGPPKQLLESNVESLTADYLRGKRNIEIPKTLRKGNGKEIKLFGCRGNNLKNIDFTLPLGVFVCITGVSGSGKSSLINGTLHPILSKYFYRSDKNPLPYNRIEGIENIDKVIEINQFPIGRTPRSNPATYIGVFDEIRKVFASLPSAKIRNYSSGRFSFNVKGGRCEECQGSGVKQVEMNFLPDVYVRCQQCNGKRYNRETLEVRYKGKSISDVLDMSFNEAVVFFENYPKIKRQLSIVKEVGLGYLNLGQSSTTLSGGESQRIKLAAELGKKDTGNTLYILDEPTTGLHFEDIRILLEVLNKLLAKGNSIVVIEHNLDVIKTADYIIDLGKEAGEEGGRIVFEGLPKDIIKNPDSITGQYLKKEFE